VVGPLADYAPTRVALLPDGKRALSGSFDKTLRLWDLDTGAQLHRFHAHDSGVSAVAPLLDGKRALSASFDKTLRLWDLDTGAQLRRFDGHADMVFAVALLPDGKRALSGSFDKTLRLWDLDTGAQLGCFTSDTSFNSFAIEATRNLVAIGDSKGRVIPLYFRV
jgi:WD40 repeat protein